MSGQQRQQQLGQRHDHRQQDDGNAADPAQLLQVRRSTYHDVVKVADVEPLMDLEQVQQYVINQAKVVFLQPRSQPRPPKGPAMPSRCVVDGRQLMDPGTCYCSLWCKFGGAGAASGSPASLHLPAPIPLPTFSSPAASFPHQRTPVTSPRSAPTHSHQGRTLAPLDHTTPHATELFPQQRSRGPSVKMVQLREEGDSRLEKSHRRRTLARGPPNDDEGCDIPALDLAAAAEGQADQDPECQGSGCPQQFPGGSMFATDDRRGAGNMTSSGGSRGNSLLAVAAAAQAAAAEDAQGEAAAAGCPRSSTPFDRRDKVGSPPSEHSGAPHGLGGQGSAAAARAAAAAAAVSDDGNYIGPDGADGLVAESESDGEGVDGPCLLGRASAAAAAGAGSGRFGGGRGVVKPVPRRATLGVKQPKKRTALALKLQRRRLSKALAISRGGGAPGGGKVVAGVKRGRQGPVEEDEGSETELTEAEEAEEEEAAMEEAETQDVPPSKARTRHSFQTHSSNETRSTGSTRRKGQPRRSCLE
ncbi:MAG: hypothetical protein WDW36_004453 [Sanguina aurantia]